MKKGFTPTPFSILHKGFIALIKLRRVVSQKFQYCIRTYVSRKTIPRKVWGFTLVEMLVGVAIVALLAAVTLVSVGKAREKGTMTRAKTEVDQIATGAYLYYQDTGTWAPDVPSTGGNALFYDQKYLNIPGMTATFWSNEPASYLGSGYFWDWQSWDFPNKAGFMCWQSEDLYQGTPGSGTLIMRKCVRDLCSNQKYCNQSGICFNTAADRDNNINPLGLYSAIGASPVCESCTSQTDCAKKFIK